MKVIIIHQHDPGINHVAGIGTFINTFVKYAPRELEVSLVGVSADASARPVGRWQRVRVGEKICEFLPLVAAHPGQRERVPLSLRFTWALARARRDRKFRHALLEFHRIEPSAALRDLAGPKILFLHSHMQDLYNPKTEVSWKKCPWLYFWMERRLIRTMERIYIVREDAVPFYRARYPAMADRITFLPTWMDEQVFRPLPESERKRQRAQLAQRHGFDPAHRLLLFVGRFEGQKDPVLLLEAFRRLNGFTAQTRLVMIGEGSLEPEIRAFLAAHALTDAVCLLGPQPQTEIAKWMNIADCLCLSSAFEGMPRVIVESLACGLPVVTTDVGEARRLIQGTVGRLVTERTPEALGAAIASLLRQPPHREACERQAIPYTATKVLEPVYGYYRELGKRIR